MAVAIDPSKPVARAVGKQVREDTGEVGTSIWGVVVAETHRGRRSMAVEFSRLGTAVVVELVGRLGVKEERGDRWDLRVASPGRTMANEGGGPCGVLKAANGGRPRLAPGWRLAAT
jgi:hypothetical protein